MTNSDPFQWHFIDVPQEVEARFRRWNWFMIAILALVVIGLMVIATVPSPTNTLSTTNTAPLKNHRQHTP
jgi:uncharacterized protein YpmS